MKTLRASAALSPLRLVARLGLGAVFLWAGMAKLRTPGELAVSVASFRVVPEAWIPLLADSLPFFEALTGCWLLLGWRPRVPALAALLLAAVFVLATVQAMLRGLDLACACFGPATADVSPWWLLVRGLLLFAAAAFLRASRAGEH